MTTEIETFLSTIEQFLSESGISPTRFGKEFANDPLFVFQLRAGREPRSETRRKVLSALAASSPILSGSSVIHSGDAA